MLKRKIQNKKRYFQSFVIGTLVFAFIFSLSYLIAFYQSGKVSSSQGITGYVLFEDKAAYSFFGEDICSNDNLKRISESLSYQGRVLEDLEEKFGKNNEMVLERKKFYSVLLLEHLDYVQEYNEKCTPPKDTILYFYSNIEGSEEADISEKVGKILDNVYADSENLIIYAFDTNLDSSIVQKLKEKYNVTHSPEIVVNENNNHVWPFARENIEKYLLNF